MKKTRVKACFLLAVITFTLLSGVLSHKWNWKVGAGQPTEPHNADAMWVEPSTFSANVTLGLRFNVTVWLNITSTNVYCYQVALHYNSTQMKFVSAGYAGMTGATSDFMSGHITIPAGPINSTARGVVTVYEGLLGSDYVAAPRIGSLVWIEFEVAYLPSPGEVLTSKFDISSTYPRYTYALDSNLDNIPMTVYDGLYNVGTGIVVHDIAVSAIRASVSSTVGDPVPIEVDVKNQGNMLETDNVTLYEGSVYDGNETTIAVKTVQIEAETTLTLVFSWDTTSFAPGGYNLRAVASPLIHESNFGNNNQTFGTITLSEMHPHSADAMWVEQPDTILTFDNATFGSRFIVTLWLNITENTYFWQAYMDYDPTQLHCTGAGFTAGSTSQYFVGHSTVLIGPFISESSNKGTVWGSECLLGPDFVQGPHWGSLMWIEFEVVATPTVKNLASRLNLNSEKNNNFVLEEDGTTEIDPELYDGQYEFVRYPPVHDVAVASVHVSQNAVYAGDPVAVDVDVWNKGNVPENVDVTVYADVNTSIIGDEVTVGSSLVALDVYGSSTVTFNWDTSNDSAGNYTLTACVSPLPGEVDLADNNMTDGSVMLFETLEPCPDINVICPENMTVNPDIFTFDPVLHARLINIGNVSITSTGFEGGLRVVGSINDTIHLCVEQPGSDYFTFYLNQNDTVQVPLWLMFQPEAHWGEYSGIYTLSLTVCGLHRNWLTINDIEISVCQNGAYVVNSQTASFTWNLTEGSPVYLGAVTNLPQGWTYSGDPPIGTLFWTPQLISVNITAPSDAQEGDIGRVALSAYENSTGAMIWQFVYFATNANSPPKVERVETPTFSPDGYLLFNTTVAAHSGINSVLLHYSVNGGPWQNASMQWVSGDTFSATQYACRTYFGTGQQTIQYYVSADDWLGNETDSSIQNVSLMDDVAVANFSLGKTVVFEGYNFSVTASVANQGTLPLSYVNVALYANSTVVATRSILNLQNGSSVTLNFTAVLPKGNYVMAILATPLPDENKTDNNVCFDMIRVTMTGDLTGTTLFVPDGKVDIRNAVVAKCFGSTPGDPAWKTNCDVNNDGIINIRDIALVAKHFGERS